MQIQQSIWRLLGIIFFNILGMFLGFIILAFASKGLSLDEFGLLGVVTSILYVPGLIANVIQISGMQAVPTSLHGSESIMTLNDNRKRILSHFRFSIAVTSILIFFLVLDPVDYDMAFIQNAAVIILCFVIIFSSLFQGRYLSSGRFTEFHAVGFFVSIIRTIVTIIFLERGHGIVAFLMIYATSTGAVGIFCAIKSRHVSWLNSQQFTRKFIFQAGTLGLTALCFQIDVILSTSQISRSQTGVYFAAAQPAKLTCLIVLSASLAFLPAILNKTGRETVNGATLDMGSKFSFIISSLLSLALLFFGSKLIEPLFGQDFANATIVIPYLILGIIAWSILLTKINLNISEADYRVISMLCLLIIFSVCLTSVSNSMQTIALSWSITSLVGLGLYTYLSQHNWFRYKTKS